MNGKTIRDYAIPFLITGLLAWATWITTSIYAEDKKSAVTAKQMEAVCEKVSKVETDIKEIKQEIKDQNEKVNKNQVDVMKMLIDIKKNTQ